MSSIILGMKFLLLLGFEGKVFSKYENLNFSKTCSFVYLFTDDLKATSIIWHMQ